MLTLTLRSPETQLRYEQHLKKDIKACPFCLPTRKTKTTIATYWNYWAIVPNDFPYDSVFSEHDMIIPLRHVSSWDLMTSAERKEYEQVRRFCLQNYDCIMENSTARKTVAHWHQHILVYKQQEEKLCTTAVDD